VSCLTKETSQVSGLNQMFIFIFLPKLDPNWNQYMPVILWGQCGPHLNPSRKLAELQNSNESNPRNLHAARIVDSSAA
jgi:hypothetical protein